MEVSEHVIPALRSRLLVVVDDADVAWHNKARAPEVGLFGYYIEEIVGPENEVDTAVGGQRVRRADGSYQVMVCVPLDSDVQLARNVANQIKATFLRTPAYPLGSTGYRLVVTDGMVGGPRVETSWLKVPLVLSYTYTYTLA